MRKGGAEENPGAGKFAKSNGDGGEIFQAEKDWDPGDQENGKG